MFDLFKRKIDILGINVVLQYLRDVLDQIVDVPTSCFPACIVFDVIEQQPRRVETGRVRRHR